MNTRHWMSLAALAVLTLAGHSCNDDWGQVDPPAGNQVYPTLQNVGTTTFEGEDGALLPDGIELGGITQPTLIYDDSIASYALSLNGGYATMPNPLTGVKLQKAAGFTMWVYQPQDTDSEGNLVGQRNLNATLLQFVYDSNAVDSRADMPVVPSVGNVSISVDGKLAYNGSCGDYTQSDPATADGFFTPNKWHFVGVNIHDGGYDIFVDGESVLSKQVSDFPYSYLVEAINSAQKINLGGAGADLMYDDITIFRNQMTAKEISVPRKGNSGGSADELIDIKVDPLFGPENNEQGWWSIWSPSVNLEGDGTIHYEFTNYTLGNQNWENWVLVLTNSGLSPNDEGYDGSQELIVLRADAWGWAALYGASTVEHDYNWDTFRSDMNGAKVSIDITRTGKTVVMTAVTTTTEDKVYTYKVTIPGVTEDLLGSFFTLENAHMVFDVDATFIGKSYEPGTMILGSKDFTNGFWSCWTKMERFDKPFIKQGFEFINHSEKGGNWQFWNLVVTNGYQSAPDGERDPAYSEWLYMRCDAWGWATLFGETQMTQSFNWDTFIEDMDGARSRIYFSDVDDTFTMVARQWRADGTEIPEFRTVTPNLPLPVGIVFTCEHSWLDFLRIGYYPWARLEAK